MTTHPYISGAGNITQMVVQLRKSFPATVSSDTVKKLGLAPNNESYVRAYPVVTPAHQI